MLLPAHPTQTNTRRVKTHETFVGEKDGLLLVWGRLEKRHAGRSRIPGHLHIEVFGKDGSMLGEEMTRYYRCCGKSGISRFSREFSVQPGEVLTVRVIHHVREDNEIGGGVGQGRGSLSISIGSIQPA